MTRQRGADWEAIAATYLRSHGLEIIDRNYRCRHGEIDVIAMHERCLVFAEVRYRRNGRFGTAAISVARSKQIKLIKTAAIYAAHRQRSDNDSMRFDVIAIDDDNAAGDYSLTWIKHAFDATGLPFG